MRFLALVKHSENLGRPPEGLMVAMHTLVADGLREGVLLETGGLSRMKNAIHVRQSGGKLSVTDGPFAEAKEVAGGFAILELPSREAALEWTQRFMQIHLDAWPEFEGESEVREMHVAFAARGRY